MEPQGTPALTGLSCEEFPSRTTRSHLLLRKTEIRVNNITTPWAYIQRAYIQEEKLFNLQSVKLITFFSFFQIL